MSEDPIIRTITTVDLRPDPRISNLRPGWLADDQHWRIQLGAMHVDDTSWIEHHWDLASGPGPSEDMSWITFERADGGGRIWLFLASVVALAIMVGAGTMLEAVR